MPALAFCGEPVANPDPPAGTFAASVTAALKFSASCGTAWASSAWTWTLKESPARTFAIEPMTRVRAVTLKVLLVAAFGAAAGGAGLVPVALTE